MRKIAFFSLVVLSTLLGCKKNEDKKPEENKKPEIVSPNADIAGNYQLTSYQRSDSQEYMTTDFPCLSATIVTINTNNTTKAYSATGVSCPLYPPPTGLAGFSVGGGKDTSRSTYVRTGNDLVVSFTQSAGTVIKSHVNVSTVGGKLTLNWRDTLTNTFSGMPLYIKSVYVKQ